MQFLMQLSLGDRFVIPGVARVSEGNGGLTRVTISDSHAQGEIYLQGAHVTYWRPSGQGGSFSQLKITVAGRPAHPRGDPGVFSLVSRESRRSSRSGTWIRAHQKRGAPVHPSER